jgi:hypothetical protein
LRTIAAGTANAGRAVGCIAASLEKAAGRHARLHGGPTSTGLKAHTDFNDRASRSTLGRAGVERQVTDEVDRVIREAEVRRERIQAQERQPIQEQPPRRAARMA